MNIVELHNKAMKLADEADFQIRIGNKKKAQKLYAKAYFFEKEASSGAVYEHVGEPSETVLLKSAAFLAFDAKLFEESEKMARIALSRKPSKEMEEELNTLLKSIHVERRLSVGRNSLKANEILIAVAGQGDNQEQALKDDLEDRIKIFNKMAVRAAEWGKNIAYRQSGRPSKEIQELFRHNLSIARETPQVVTMRLAQEGTESTSPECRAQVKMIVDDIATNLDLANQGKLSDLFERFKDRLYFENFLTLAKEFAPDGENVDSVIITYLKKGKKVPIRLTRQKRDYKEIIRDAQSYCGVVKKDHGSKANINTIKGTLSASNLSGK